MAAAKPKIAVVAGEIRHPRFLALFEALREAYDVVVYALSDARLIDHHGTGLKVRLFEPIRDMPGYMRGLEEELAQARFVIGLETSRLATFQAVRAARKYGVPMGVVVNEWHPYFYERYANIRAIQFDICNKSERFWCTSKAAADALRLDQVPEELIRPLAPVVDVTRFKPSADGRKKFRDYVGVGADELVVLYQHDLEPFNRPEEVLRAFALLRRQAGPHAGKLRLMLAGTGTAAMELKYKSHDLGLGKSVMFLHQDPEPFLLDLYAACDVMLAPRPQRTEFHEEFPMPLVEAMACGVVPLVGAGSVPAELAGDAGLVFPDDTYQALAAELQRLVTNPHHLATLRERAVARVRSSFCADAVREAFVAEIETVLCDKVANFARQQDPDALFDSVRADLQRGAERDALMKIEEALLLDLKVSPVKAELYCLRGDAYYGLGDIEAAMNSYSEAMRLDERNHRALRGLGFVAWQGHSNEDALTFFKKAIALKEDDPETMLGIGLVYRRLGLTEEALFWLEKCVVSAEPPAASVVALAQTCAQAHDSQRGIEVLERVIDAIGEKHTLMMTLGQLYLNVGMTEEGNEILQKAL